MHSCPARSSAKQELKMSISEDLLHVNAALGTVAQGLSGEDHALLQMIAANIHALAEQVEALEGVPLEMCPYGTPAATAAFPRRRTRLAPVTGAPPQ